MQSLALYKLLIIYIFIIVIKQGGVREADEQWRRLGQAMLLHPVL